jgi:hypothetical protein
MVVIEGAGYGVRVLFQTELAKPRQKLLEMLPPEKGLDKVCGHFFPATGHQGKHHPGHQSVIQGGQGFVGREIGFDRYRGVVHRTLVKINWRLITTSCPGHKKDLSEKKDSEKQNKI